MPQLLKSILIHITLGTCILLQAGCANSEDEIGAWDLEDEVVDIPFLPGLYKAEFEVIHDGCEPSLHDIFGKIEGWPPPQAFVHNSTQVGDYRGLTPIIFTWRDGQFLSVTIPADDDFVPFSTNLWSGEWPTLYWFSGLNCSYDALQKEPYLHLRQVEVSLIEPNTVEVLVNNKWGDLEECVGQPAREMYKTIPRRDCSESYKTTYRLVEPCSSPCGDPTTSLMGTIIDGYPFYRYMGPFPSCHCDQ